MNINLLENLTKEQKRLLKVKHFFAKEFLYREKEECYSICIVVDGSIKISSTTTSGKEIIYNIAKKNDVFGNNLIFSSDPFYKGNVVALEDSLVVIIEKENLVELLKNNSVFLRNYLKIQSDFTKSLNATIKLLSLDSAEEKLMFYLNQHGNVITYKTITLLSEDLHIKRETLSRLITKLEKKNVIKRSSRIISLINH